MTSICPPTFPSPLTDSNSLKLKFTNSRSKFSKRSSHSPISISRVSDFNLCCRCISSGDGESMVDSGSWWSDFGIQEKIRTAIKQFEDYLGSYHKSKDDVKMVKQGEDEGDWDWDWDWERWMKHFGEVDDQERIVSILKSQLAIAIKKEDYEDAARLKVAMAAAATNDTVGRVMSHLKKSVEEERYGDASLLRDYAGAGLVGWWSGISEDASDPYGRIIHITADYGRYIARSYSPRQLASASDGAPLFEVYLTNTRKGEYKQQAVYLKRKAKPSLQDLYIPPFKSPASTRNNLDTLDVTDNKTDLFERTSEDIEDNSDRDDDSDFDSVLRDMIPGVKVKVVKVTSPEKVDRDLISNVIEQIIDEEEEEEKDYDLEDIDDIKSENEKDRDEIVTDADSGISEEDEEKNRIAVEVVLVGDSLKKISKDKIVKDLLRVPARLEKKGRLAFTFTVEDEAEERTLSPQKKRAKILGQRGMDNVMLDLVKSIGKGKVPRKVLKDVGELINLSLSQARNRQPLSGSTAFTRIDISSTLDPLNGLYIGAHGLYTSEVIQVKRRFGQWKEEGSSKKPSKVEFYEYVEAVKLTGDPYVPAGQVAFRAKVGKGYQLPHRGIIPEEFGVIARYRGQGRLAEPGFKNPRWVDGELVILDGKYIKGGPVVGFVYWAPEFHFLVFFSRLRLQD